MSATHTHPLQENLTSSSLAIVLYQPEQFAIVPYGSREQLETAIVPYDSEQFAIVPYDPQVPYLESMSRILLVLYFIGLSNLSSLSYATTSIDESEQLFFEPERFRTVIAPMHYDVHAHAFLNNILTRVQPSPIDYYFPSHFPLGAEMILASDFHVPALFLPFLMMMPEHGALSAFEEVLQRSIFETTSAHSAPNTFCSARQQRFDALQSSSDDTELDTPEEYLCNLSAQIMDDPVKLPSGEICERAVITRVIEESGRNPYTRAPLSISDLESSGELSGQIESFLRQLERNQENASNTTPGL
jgi:hypothetical protein